MLGARRWPAALLWSVALVQLAARAGAKCYAGKPAYGCYDARNASRRALLHVRVMPYEYIKSQGERITLLSWIWIGIREFAKVSVCGQEAY